jgi:mono/diheme cytochrome c family protein
MVARVRQNGATSAGESGSLAGNGALWTDCARCDGTDSGMLRPPMKYSPAILSLLLAAGACVALAGMTGCSRDDKATTRSGSAAPQDAEDQPGVVPTLKVRMERGRRVYLMACFACHQADGRGLPGVFPPLAGSDYLKEEKERTIRIPLRGLTGPIVINGKSYNGIMPPQAFTDRQIADVLTYVMNSWGNDCGTVSVDEVKRTHGIAR